MVKSYDINLVYSVAVSVSSSKIDKSKVYFKEDKVFSERNRFSVLF